MKNFIKKILDKFKKKGLTFQEYHNAFKNKSKGDIIREIVITTQRIAKNNAGITTTYKKKLRREAKKNLLKTLILLKIQDTKQIKKLRRKYAKEETRRNKRGFRKPVHGSSRPAEV